MEDFVFYLDGIAFENFEIPEKISGGGAQALVKHKYPGGSRTIDAMGADDDDISFAGTFMDEDAQQRCQQIDTIRRQGQQVVLTYGAFSFLVIVAEFKWDFERVYQIPYTITLAVVQDQTQPLQVLPEDADSAVGSAQDDALDDADSLDDADLDSSLGSITTSLQSVPSITTGSSAFIATLMTQVATAQARAAVLQGKYDASMNSAGASGNFASGTDPQVMIANINALVANGNALAASVDCSVKLGTMAVSIASVLN